MMKDGMTQSHGTRVMSPVRLILLATTILATNIAMPAVAQTPSTAQSPRTISIPAGPLTPALNQLAAQTGMQILFDASLARGKTTRGVQGNMTAAQALPALLAGTGLGARVTGPNTATIVGPATAAGPLPADAIPLDTIDVQGDGTVGYVATRSSAGTKTDTPLMETPQTINVVTREQLTDQAATTVPQALRYTPGVLGEAFGDERTFDQGLTIRGFGFNSDQFYLNGLKQQVVNGFNPYFFERLDVIKGPASVLYGQASPGGLVSITTKQPTAQPIREVEFVTGYPGRAQAAFDLGGPIDKEGKFLYRITGIGLEEHSNINYTKGQNFGIAPSFTWRPTTDTSLNVYALYQHNPAFLTSPGLPAYGLPVRGNFQPSPYGHYPRDLFIGEPNYDRNSQTSFAVGYNFDHRFNEFVKFSSTTRYLSAEQSNRFLDFDWPIDDRNGSRWASDQRIKGDSIATDNRLQFNFNTFAISHQLIAGVDYQNHTSRAEVGRCFCADVPPINYYNPVYPGYYGSFPLDDRSSQKANQTGIYFQDQMKLGRLSVVVGGRRDTAEGRAFNDVTGVKTSDQKDSATTWRAGAIYEFENGIAPYFSYSESFEPMIGLDFFKNQFRPTTGVQYEAGIKYQIPGSSTLITASVFDLARQNVLTPDNTPGHQGYSIQVGEVRSRGFELSAMANVSENLKLIASYAYTDARITKSTREVEIGQRFSGVPYNTFALWGDYTFTVGALRGFGFAAGVRYQDEVFTGGGAMTIPSRALVDAALHYDLGALEPSLRGLSAAVNVSNLFDKEYVSNCAYEQYCFRGPGRIVTGRLTYRW